MTAILSAHVSGSLRRSRDELALIATPEATRSWQPVPHADLVAALVAGLGERGITVTRDEYATGGPTHARLFGVMQLAAPMLDAPDFSMALGLRGANDRSMSIQLCAGARVFVCDNMCFSGTGGVVLSKRHTSRLDLGAVVPAAIERFLGKALAYQETIDEMRDLALSGARAKELIHDAFTQRSPVLPLRLLPNVSHLYFDDHEQRDKFPERSLWSLNNAMTEAVKVLGAVPSHEYGVRIGQFCARAVRPPARFPVAIIDGVEVYRDGD